MALLSSAVCYTRINIIRDVSVADHFTCEMKGFPLQICSLALWSAGHCKEALHETVDSVLGKYFKWTSYLCLSLSPQAPDLKRQQRRERTRVSASNGLLKLYLATILKLINLWCCCPRVLCSEDITKAGLALVSLNIHWTSLRQVAPSAAPGPTKLSIRESINLALALTATSETCWRTGSLASPHFDENNDSKSPSSDSKKVADYSKALKYHCIHPITTVSIYDCIYPIITVSLSTRD